MKDLLLKEIEKDFADYPNGSVQVRDWADELDNIPMGYKFFSNPQHPSPDYPLRINGEQACPGTQRTEKKSGLCKCVKYYELSIRITRWFYDSSTIYLYHIERKKQRQNAATLAAKRVRQEEPKKGPDPTCTSIIPSEFELKKGTMEHMRITGEGLYAYHGQLVGGGATIPLTCYLGSAGSAMHIEFTQPIWLTISHIFNMQLYIHDKWILFPEHTIRFFKELSQKSPTPAVQSFSSSSSDATLQNSNSYSIDDVNQWSNECSGDDGKFYQAVAIGDTVQAAKAFPKFNSLNSAVKDDCSVDFIKLARASGNINTLLFIVVWEQVRIGKLPPEIFSQLRDYVECAHELTFLDMLFAIKGEGDDDNKLQEITSSIMESYNPQKEKKQCTANSEIPKNGATTHDSVHPQRSALPNSVSSEVPIHSPEWKLPVFCKGANTESIKALKETLADIPVIIVDPPFPHAFHLLIHCYEAGKHKHLDDSPLAAVESSGNYKDCWVVTLGSFVLFPPRPLQDFMSLCQDLVQFAKFIRILLYPPPRTGGLSLSLYTAKKIPLQSMHYKLQQDEDQILISITNTHTQALYIYMLCFDMSHSVNLVQGETILCYSGETMRLALVFQQNQIFQEFSKKLYGSECKQQDYITVIGSTSPLDFSFLSQEFMQDGTSLNNPIETEPEYFAITFWIDLLYNNGKELKELSLPDYFKYASHLRNIGESNNLTTSNNNNNNYNHNSNNSNSNNDANNISNTTIDFPAPSRGSSPTPPSPSKLPSSLLPSSY